MANQNIAVVLAAGKGERFTGSVPKQYTKIFGESLLKRVVNKFINHELIDETVVVIDPNHIEMYQHEIEGLRVLPYVVGGARRQDSVRNALEAIERYLPHNVFIHDAARPFVGPTLITEIVKSLKDYEGVVAAAKVVDTLKYVTNEHIEKTLSRDNLFLVQTPQAFRYKVIRDLHKKFQDLDFTDDSSLFEHIGKKVKIVKSSIKNFKITMPSDLELAKSIWESQYE